MKRKEEEWRLHGKAFIRHCNFLKSLKKLDIAFFMLPDHSNIDDRDIYGYTHLHIYA